MSSRFFQRINRKYQSIEKSIEQDIDCISNDIQLYRIMDSVGRFQASENHNGKQRTP